MNVICSMITIPEVNIHKLKMEISINFSLKIRTDSQILEKSPSVFPTYVRIQYKKRNSITFYDSYFQFNSVKHYWNVKSDIYIVQQLL